MKKKFILFSPWLLESPVTQRVYTLGPMYLYRDYFKVKVYAVWVYGPLGKLAQVLEGARWLPVHEYKFR